MPYCMPVTWNSGSTDRITDSAPEPDQVEPPTMLCITERCVWIQPLGKPVVPEV